jgi:hypothetical protein
MIDTAGRRSNSSRLLTAGRALVERFGAAHPEMPETGSVEEWVEGLGSRLSAVPMLTVVEHLFGVLPLVDACCETRGVFFELASGWKLASLGLFTPTPELGWEAAAVEGELVEEGLLLHGEIRIPGSACDGSIVLVRLAGPSYRLVWLDHRGRGVERRGTNPDGPCWLDLTGAEVAPDRVSRVVEAVTLRQCLQAYAVVWAFAAAVCAREGVRRLRCAARIHGSRGTAFSASQWVALGITEVEVEADLTLGAARRLLGLSPDDLARAPGLAVATAAARALAALAAKTAELRDYAGLPLDGPFAEAGSARALTSFFGGPLMLERELARDLGIRELGMGPTNP